jgi:hypothetical protein
MIFQNKNKVPFIHFGFNSQSKSVSIGGEVVIWQTEIYNPSIYETNINATGSPTVVSEGLNKSVLTFGGVGVYTTDIDVSNKLKTITKKSNIITVTVFYSFTFSQSGNTQYLQFITQ